LLRGKVVCDVDLVLIAALDRFRSDAR